PPRSSGSAPMPTARRTRTATWTCSSSCRPGTSTPSPSASAGGWRRRSPWTSSSAPRNRWPGAWRRASRSRRRSCPRERSSMKKTTREGVKKAEQDHVLAKHASRSKVPVHDGVCFHCQQCAEKYLKGMMEELGLPVPKTHVLDPLLTPLVPHHPTLRSVRRGPLFLSVFALDPRSPG